MQGNNTEWWRGASIYQIYPRSFCDSNGDGIGDLPGIISRLPYIADLGVDAIWISPFFRSPMKDFGYDVADYCDVDPMFGTLEDFDRLLSTAHGLGLKVIIDQVLSHTSDQHVWFKRSRLSRDNPYADWYVWVDPLPDGSPPNNWLSVFGGVAWQWDSRRCQYYLHNFLSSQPDLNFDCEAVQAQLLETVRFWCERGVDGFRFDACNFHFHDKLLRNNPPKVGNEASSAGTNHSNPYYMQEHTYDKTRPENLVFLQRLRTVLDEYGVASLGEVGDDACVDVMAQYTANGDKLHMAYSFNFLTEVFTPQHIRNEVEHLEAKVNAVQGWGCWAFSNHDSERVLTRWASDVTDPTERQAVAKVLIGVLGSLRGSFCVYQGEELGLDEADVAYEHLRDPYGIAFWPDYRGRDGCRTPIPWEAQAAWAGFSTNEPWLPLSRKHIDLAVDVQQANPLSVLSFYQHFLTWRRKQPALISGSIEFIKAPDSVLCFKRCLDGEEVFAAFNLSCNTVAIDVPLGITALTGHGFAALSIREEGKRAHVSLPPWAGFFGVCSR